MECDISNLKQSSRARARFGARQKEKGPEGVLSLRAFSRDRVLVV
jgi:hypothetical protein